MTGGLANKPFPLFLLVLRADVMQRRDQIRRAVPFALQALLACGGVVSACSLSGCQSSVGGQTLPSPNYLRDDVQYFPPGPEFLLPNSVRAIEEYKASQGAGDDNSRSGTPYNP